MMIRPGKLLCAHLGKCIIRKGRSKSERMDGMREWMATWDRSIEEIIEIVDMHIPVAETPSRRNVEISNNLIDSDASLDTAPLLSLQIQSFSVVFPFALFYILSPSKSPRLSGISFSNLLASITTSLLLCIWRRLCAVTTTTVVRSQVRSLIVSMPMKSQ